jgi:hypothetical protein
MFSKNFWGYGFVSLAITSAMSGVQITQNIPVNGKRGRSTPDLPLRQVACYFCR